MASTATVTAQDHRSIKRYTVAWVSHTDGTISNVLKDSNGNNIIFNGVLMRVTIIPGTGADEPDDNYVLTLNDANSVDVLANQGAALDEATTTDFCPGTTLTDDTTPGSLPFTIDSILTLTGSGAGSANVGTIVLYFS